MRLSPSLLLAAMLLASFPAQAENVFLVQLGSFKTEADATASWERSRLNYPETLGKLFHQNSAITLPPSNTQLYRLQAGPFPSREDAASICNALAQDGAACFVVESAAFLPKEPPVAAAEKPAPAAGPEKPIKAEKAEEVPSPPLPAELPESSALKKEKKKPDPELKPILEAEAAADILTETKPQPPLPQKLTPGELASVGNEPAAGDAVAAPEPAVDAPLPWKKTASLPATKEERKKSPAPAALPPEPEPEVAAKAAKPEEPAMVPLPAPAAGPAFSAPAATAVAPPPATRKPMLPLPGATAPTATPADSEKQSPRSLSGEDRLSPTDGRVEVGEAIAVPPSELPGDRAADAKKAEAAPEIALSGKRAQGWKASPSKNLLQHASWVQIRYFTSEQAALNHWQLLRRQLPNLTREMRVRVTRPYTGNFTTPRVSLAVGPFLQRSDVRKFCDHVATEEVSCQLSQDLGTGAAAYAPRTRKGGEMLSRREVVGYQGVGSPQYWVQLGSYSSRREADRFWEDLSGQHTELQTYSPSVSQPRLSSSPAPVYRLRTGPFQLRYSAQELCDQLNAKKVSCLVVSG